MTSPLNSDQVRRLASELQIDAASKKKQEREDYRLRRLEYRRLWMRSYREKQRFESAARAQPEMEREYQASSRDD